MKIQVVIQAGDGTERREVRPADGPISVGRHPQCVLCLDSDQVSRQHAVIEVGPSTIRVKDVSTNGTFAGDRLLRRQSVSVPYGTPIVVGDFTVYFFPMGVAPAVPPPVPQSGPLSGRPNAPSPDARRLTPERNLARTTQPPAAIVEPAAVQPSPKAGGAAERLANRYRVGSELGRGGTSVVYEAEDVQTGKAFAVKVLDRAPSGTETAKHHVLLEAQLAMRLTSPNAVKLFEVGVLADGRPFLVMERLWGQDAAHHLVEHGPMPVMVAAEVVLQACHALAEAHRLGVVHRDIKPANLFLSKKPDGSTHVKVLDFGLAMMVAPDSEAPDSTRAPKTLHASGSAGYAAPEQIGSARSIDERTDVWALGVVLYELVTLRRPFEGTSLIESLIAAGSQPLPPMGSVPPGFEAVVRRCLEKESELRFPNAVALAEALAPFAPQRLVGYVEHVRRARGRSVQWSGADSGHTMMDAQGPISLDLSRPQLSAASAGDAPPQSAPRSAPRSAGSSLLVSQLVPARAPPWIVLLALLVASAVVASIVLSHARDTSSPKRQAPSAASSVGPRTPSMRLDPLKPPSAASSRGSRPESPPDPQEAP